MSLILFGHWPQLGIPTLKYSLHNLIFIKLTFAWTARSKFKLYKLVMDLGQFLVDRVGSATYGLGLDLENFP